MACFFHSIYENDNNFTYRTLVGVMNKCLNDIRDNIDFYSGDGWNETRITRLQDDIKSWLGSDGYPSLPTTLWSPTPY
eukprot:UN06768